MGFDPDPVPFRLLVDCIPDYAIFMTDAEGRIASWNAGGHRIYGYDASEVFGAHFSMLYEAKLVASGAPPAHLATAAAVGRCEEDGWHRRKDGTHYWASIIIARVHDDTGKLKGFAVVCRDATERRDAQEKLEHERDRLESLVAAQNRVEIELQRSNRDLQDFALVASHDLQEPLRKIKMFGDRLKKEFGDKLGASGADYIERMQLAGMRGQVLVDGLLEYARVASVARPVTKVNIGEVVRTLRDDFAPRLAAVSGKIDVADLPVIEAEPLQMRQLFENLFANAIKFRSPERPLIIAVKASPASSRDGAWVISVADNGIGFDQKYADKIFKLFQRLHERTIFDGAGIGLAICRRIVERHGGSVTARSTLGEGSTFCIVLPASAGAIERNAE